jgi:serine protease Do
MKIKDILVYFVIAIVAGLVAVFAYSKSAPQVIHEVSYREKQPVWFASLPEDFKPDQLDFTYAAEKTIHGVVHVTTLRQREARRDPMREFFGFPQDAPQQVEGIGSGVIVSEDGYIVTNNHVIEGASAIEVTLNDGRAFEAQVVGRDPNTDLALLKIEQEGLHYIEFGNSDDLRVGQWVLAVGNPMNLVSTVTAGIVSAKGRGLGVLGQRRGEEGRFAIESFIQTDAAVNQGNSGGALVNLKGELVGIPTLILSPTGASAGNAFAVPVSIVQKVVEDMIEFGEVQRAMLGVSARGVDSQLAREEGLGRVEGVYVAEVTPDGAARAAGIREGDVILRVDDTRINSMPELQEKIARYRPKDEVRVLIKRNGETREVKATLRNIKGQTELVKPQETFLGASFREVPSDLKKELNLDHGVQISSLAPGKFRSHGIREGFIIESINNNAVKKPSDVEEILKGFEGGVYIEGTYPNGSKAYYAFGL